MPGASQQNVHYSEAGASGCGDRDVARQRPENPGLDRALQCPRHLSSEGLPLRGAAPARVCGVEGAIRSDQMTSSPFIRS